MIQTRATLPIESTHEDLFSGESIVEIQNLTRRFGRKLALADVSLTIPRGIVMGLVGLNGAGKTTLLKHVLGVLRAQSGSVSVFGKDPSRDPESVLSRLGYLTEEDTLPNWMKVHQLLRFAKPFYPKWDDKYAEELLDTFELSSQKTIGSLSKGQRARVGLTVALAHRPELLVMDEPSSGLDPVVRQDILSAIIRTIADAGQTVLFSSHLLDEVQRVSDLIAVIRNGELIECGPMENLQTRYQRVTVQVGDDSMTPPPLDVLGEWQQSGSEWTGIVEVIDENLEVSVRAFGGKIVRTTGISLNDWFLSSSR